mgnify:CR=1 FL=1
MSPTKSYYDLRDAFAQPGCPFCTLEAEYTNLFIDGLLYEQVNDPGLRAKIRQARGFCQKHAQGLVRSGASLGVAIMMRDVLREVLRAMDKSAFQAPPGLSLVRLRELVNPRPPLVATAEAVNALSPHTECPVCAHIGRLEEGWYGALLENLLGDDGLIHAYQASDGLCLPHFRGALARARQEAAFTALVDAQRAIWRKLEQELNEAIRKSDYRFKDEAWGEEGDAWLRALAAVSGKCYDRRKR